MFVGLFSEKVIPSIRCVFFSVVFVYIKFVVVVAFGFVFLCWCVLCDGHLQVLWIWTSTIVAGRRLSLFSVTTKPLERSLKKATMSVPLLSTMSMSHGPSSKIRVSLNYLLLQMCGW